VQPKISPKTVLIHVVLVVQVPAAIRKKSGRSAERQGCGVYGQQKGTQIIGVQPKISTKTVLIHVVLVVQVPAAIRKKSGRSAAQQRIGVYGQQNGTQRIGVYKKASTKTVLIHAMPVKLITTVHVFATFDKLNPLVVEKRAPKERW